MKNKFFIIPALLCLLASCTYEKGEIPKIIDCDADTTIHTHAVTIADYSFSPATITIAEGDTVKWTYVTGSDQHTVTCDGTNGSSRPAGGNTWDSGISTPLTVGGTYKTAISVPGTYIYVCTIHAPFMSGTIIVKPRCH